MGEYWESAPAIFVCVFCGGFFTIKKRGDEQNFFYVLCCYFSHGMITTQNKLL